MRGRTDVGTGEGTERGRGAKQAGPRRKVRFAPAMGLWAALVAIASVASPTSVDAAPCLRPPVIGTVVDPFRAPACEWCAGNRGIEYRVGPDAAVRAAATGTVTFVGSVAGTTYLVVELPNGWRLTHGRLESTRLRLGDRVVAGSIVGHATGDFYFGLRIGDEYHDPAPFIGRLIGRARLIPLDGTPALARDPADATVRTCPARDLAAGVVAAGTADSIPEVDSPGSTAVRSDVSQFRRSTSGRPSRAPTGGMQPHKENHHGRHHHAANARSRRPLRSPDPTVEPEDEAFHLR
jgi:hypothetical protein